jgi:hypothetical protein
MEKSLFQSVIRINPSNFAAQQQIKRCEIRQKELYKSFFNKKS